MDTDNNPVYTEAVTVIGSSIMHQPPATEGIVYDDIKAFQNNEVQCVCLILRYFANSFLFQGLQYAVIGNLKITGKLVDDPAKPSEIRHVLSSQQVQIIDTQSSQNIQLK